MFKVKIGYYKTNPTTPSQICEYSMMGTYNCKFVLFDLLWQVLQVEEYLKKIKRACEHNKDEMRNFPLFSKSPRKC